MSQKVDAQTSETGSRSETSASTPLGIASSSSLGTQTQSSRKRTRLIDINAELTCILCNGYFIDATTISECLHSFCKSCIVKYLETNKCCPICEAQVHKTKPLLNIRSDKILQDIVYKLIPDVFKNEMQRRRDFYAKHSEAAPTTAEDRGEVAEHRMFYMPEDKISLSLEYGYGDNQIPENGYNTTPANQQTEKTSETETMRRYLLCPAGLSILHLKKFIATKYGLPNTYKVDVMYLEDILSEDYTLMDVAYIYAWRRSDPMRLFYRICERPIKRLKTTHPQSIESKTTHRQSIESKSGSVSNVNNTNSNNTNNNSVTQSASTSNTSTFSTIMTGAATDSVLGSAGVTSSKGSTATPKNADTSASLSAYRLTSSSTAATPQGIYMTSASAVQTDEPPKKLRKILPANNSSASTPKPLPHLLTINCAATPPSTNTSTVNSLRQCRINSDKNKSFTSVNNLDKNKSLSCATNSDKNKSLSSTINSSCNVGLSAWKTVKDESVRNTCNKKSSSRKSSSFDVQTLIGTKAGAVGQNQESGNSGNESKDEISHKSSDGKKSNSSVREVSRNSVSSTCSMALSVSSIRTGCNKKPLSNPSSVAISRPPTNRSVSPNTKLATVASTRPFVPLKITKSGTFVSPKQLNVKSLKTSQSDVSVKNCGATRDVTTDSFDKPITASRSEPQIIASKPQKQSNPLSPPSIRIKLPPPPTTKSPTKSGSVTNKTTTSLGSPSVSTHNNSKNDNKNDNKTNIKEQTQSSRQEGLNESQRDSLVSDTKESSEPKKQLSESKIAVTQQKSVHISQSKSSTSQTSVTKTKGASINQIVSKIASGVTAKTASVNVTSTTPTLELGKSNTSGINRNVNGLSSSKSGMSSSANGLSSSANGLSSSASGLSSSTNGLSSSATAALALNVNTSRALALNTNISGALALKTTPGSSKVTANEVNDDKVSTTTNESGVSSSIHKNQEESAIKAVTTNTGNLVIRISTKSNSVENCVSAKDRNKFEIKRDTHKLSSTLSASDPKNDKTSPKSTNNHNRDNDDDDDDDDDNSIDGRKLVVDVPNEDSCENEVGTSKVTFEIDDIDSGRGSDIIRLSCDDIEIGSPQSTTLSIKTPESISASSDISSKLALNITSTTLSATSAVLASPPPTPTPSPKSESDPCVSIDSKSSSSSGSPNGPLDLSMSTNKKESNEKMSPSLSMRAIYDIPPPKPKHCVNPAVLDKHRGLFPPSTAPNKQHPSFKIIPTSRQSNLTQPQTSTNFNPSKKDRSINSSLISTNPTSGSNQSANSRNRSPSHHHHHHHHHQNQKNYSVITPDPHRYTPKLVIRNISSPPSITSHFNYPAHH